MANKRAVGFKHLRCAAGFAFKRIARDMRSGYVHLVKQFNVKIRLRLPDVQHNAEVLSFIQTFQQRGVVHHRATAGIYQNSASLQTTDQCFIGKMQGRIGALFKQRRVERQDIALFNQLIQRAEIPFLTVVFTRRVAQQRANT